MNPEETTVLLNWNKPKTGGSEITLYEIQRRTQFYSTTCVCERFSDWSTIFTDLPTSDYYGAYSYQDTGLSDNRMYQYQIRAVNAQGNGIFSDMREVITSSTFTTYAIDYNYTCLLYTSDAADE